MDRGQQYNDKCKEKGKYYTLYILEKLHENTYINFCMKKDWKDLLYLLNNRTLANSKQLSHQGLFHFAAYTVHYLNLIKYCMYYFYNF